MSAQQRPADGWTLANLINRHREKRRGRPFREWFRNTPTPPGIRHPLNKILKDTIRNLQTATTEDMHNAIVHRTAGWIKEKLIRCINLDELDRRLMILQDPTYNDLFDLLHKHRHWNHLWHLVKYKTIALLEEYYTLSTVSDFSAAADGQKYADEQLVNLFNYLSHRSTAFVGHVKEVITQHEFYQCHNDKPGLGGGGGGGVAGQKFFHEVLNIRGSLEADIRRARDYVHEHASAPLKTWLTAIGVTTELQNFGNLLTAIDAAITGEQVDELVSQILVCQAPQELDSKARALYTRQFLGHGREATNGHLNKPQQQRLKELMKRKMVLLLQNYEPTGNQTFIKQFDELDELAQAAAGPYIAEHRHAAHLARHTKAALAVREQMQKLLVPLLRASLVSTRRNSPVAVAKAIQNKVGAMTVGNHVTVSGRTLEYLVPLILQAAKAPELRRTEQLGGTSRFISTLWVNLERQDRTAVNARWLEAPGV